MLATLFTRQLLFDGVVTGMVYGLVAMGIVLVYRSTRVINFAVANLGFIGAGIFALLVAQYGVPFWIAAFLGLVARVRLRGGRRADRDPAAVHRAPGDRARGHDRDRPALASPSWRRSPRSMPPAPGSPSRSAPSARSPRSGSPGRRSPSSSWSPSSPSAWVGCSTARPSARRSRPRPTTPTSPASPASARRRCRPWCGPSPAAWPRCRCPCWPGRPVRPRTSTTSGRAR